MFYYFGLYLMYHHVNDRANQNVVSFNLQIGYLGVLAQLSGSVVNWSEHQIINHFAPIVMSKPLREYEKIKHCLEQYFYCVPIRASTLKYIKQGHRNMDGRGGSHYLSNIAKKTELKFYNGDLSSFSGVAKCVLYCLHKQNWGIYMPVSGVY